MRLVRYAVVGLLTLAVYLGIGWGLKVMEAALIWQSSLPFTAAVLVNYLLQRAWVFHDRRPARASVPKYLVMILVGYTINVLAVLLLAQAISLFYAQLAAATAVVASNALLAFFWVYFSIDTDTDAGSSRTRQASGRHGSL